MSMAASQSAPWSDRPHGDTLCLFDVDGTLTPARKTVEPEVKEFLRRLKTQTAIGFVGGSDLAKQKEQLGDDVVDMFDFAFAENGLTAYRAGVQLPSESFIQHIGEERYQDLADFILRYIADLKIPKKRGTFIEFRNGMINVSPIGRNCSMAERSEFEKYDLEHGIRKKFVAELQSRFSSYQLTFSIGGQISFDVFPTGWDKTYCLRRIQSEGFKTIHFCGDKTFFGGNDYEIFSHPLVTGHSVANPQDTVKIMSDIFLGEDDSKRPKLN